MAGEITDGKPQSEFGLDICSVCFVYSKQERGAALRLSVSDVGQRLSTKIGRWLTLSDNKKPSTPGSATALRVMEETEAYVTHPYASVIPP